MDSALIDANVWYPKYLRDALIEFAIEGLFHPIWSESILRETRQALARANPIFGDSFEKQIRYMKTIFPISQVWGFEHLEESFLEVNQNDRHVAAAAVFSNASHLVTFNLRDFPERVLLKQGIKSIHPDKFLSDLAEFNNESATAALARQISDYRNPKLSYSELARRFEKIKCPGFARFVESAVV